eukprot:2032388-Prymnesium_polylepis.1
MSSRRLRSGPATGRPSEPVERMSALRCHVISRSSSSNSCQRTLYSRVCPVVRLPVSRTSAMESMVQPSRRPLSERSTMSTSSGNPSLLWSWRVCPPSCCSACSPPASWVSTCANGGPLPALTNSSSPPGVPLALILASTDLR